MLGTAYICRFKNCFGATRYRFVTKSFLRQGMATRTLQAWATRAGARLAATRCGYDVAAVTIEGPGNDLPWPPT